MQFLQNELSQMYTFSLYTNLLQNVYTNQVSGVRIISSQYSQNLQFEQMLSRFWRGQFYSIHKIDLSLPVGTATVTEATPLA